MTNLTSGMWEAAARLHDETLAAEDVHALVHDLLLNMTGEHDTRAQHAQVARWRPGWGSRGLTGLPLPGHDDPLDGYDTATAVAVVARIYDPNRHSSGEPSAYGSALDAATRHAQRLGLPPGTIPAGGRGPGTEPCAYASLWGTVAWHEHDHAACLDEPEWSAALPPVERALP